MTFRKATTAVLFSASALLAPAAASAQITTFVAPPRKAAVDSVKPTVAQAKAKADSVARMSVSDMKAWVDSAAGTGTDVATASDTTMAAANAAVTTQQPNANPRSTTTTFSNGAIAPNTATSLPTYFAAGLALFVSGLVLLRRRRTG